jgi:hypothetical protein
MISTRTLKVVHIGGFILAFVVASHAAIVDSWHWRNPAPFADSMQSVAFGKGRFVAVGAGGIIHVSDDGVLWDEGQRPVATALNKVIYAGGQFLAVGAGGVILTSSNGLGWSLQSSGTPNDLVAAVYDGARYVACGAGGRIVISTNGVLWSLANAGTNGLGWITFGNGVFVLPSQGTSVLVSSDLQSWTNWGLPVPGPGDWPHILFQAEFGSGTFVATVADEQYYPPSFGWNPASHFYYSVNGTNWVQGAGANSFYNARRFLFFGNGFFNEVSSSYGQEENVRTADGTSSSGVVLSNDMYNAAAGAFGNGRYVSVGVNGTVWTSADAANWTRHYSGIQSSLGPIITDSNRYLLVATSQPILVSADGLSFFPAGNAPTGIVSAVAFDGSNYVAVGGSQIYSSSNSTTWVQRTSNTSQSLAAMCRGPARWVAVGAGGTVVTSPNTLSWTLRSSGTANSLNGVAFGNAIHVAVGNGGTIVSSPDGAAWDVQFSGTTANLNQIRFLNGQFFAVGGNGTILLSSDGSTWSPANSQTSLPLFDAAYGDGYYVVCGSTVFLLSTNGTNWQDITTKVPTAANPRYISYLNQSFWVAGDNGLLLQSDSADGIPRLVCSMLPGTGGFQLRIPINVPTNYRIQVATNLAGNSWRDVATNSSATATWTDTNAASSPAGFYRIVSP